MYVCIRIYVVYIHISIYGYIYGHGYLCNIYMIIQPSRVTLPLCMSLEAYIPNPFPFLYITTKFFCFFSCVAFADAMMVSMKET